MKVIHWNMRYLPLLGGIETHIDTLVQHMPDVEFEIVTDALPGSSRVDRYRPNASILRFPPVDKSRMNRHRKLITPIAAAKDPLREVRERKYLRDSHYDVLHVHDFEKNLIIMENVTGLRFLGELAARLHDVRGLGHPALLTKHFMATEENANPAILRWEERLVRQFDTIVCVDKPIQRKFEALQGMKRVLFIPNPIDTEQFSFAPLPQDETLHIGFVGRLDAARGERLLLDFANNLPPGVDLKLALPNPGQRLMDIKKELANDRVSLRLDVPYESVPAFLRGLHVLLNPIRDTYSTTRITLESMSAGRPVIMPNTGERYPIRHWENGFLIKPDMKSLFELVEGLKFDRKSLDAISAKAREVVEREFAAPLIASRIRELYSELSGAA